jgi:ABC-type phosphate transport system substrate-binding protein
MKSKLTSRWRSISAVLTCCAALTIVMLSVTQASGGGKENCGSTLIGGGSTMQARAQTEVWEPGWGASACETKPTVTYTPTSSGLALEQWGANKGVLGGKEGTLKPFPMFIGTDVAPEGPATNASTQMYKMVKAARFGEGEIPNDLVTVPVAQSAIAVIVSLPTGCKVDSGVPSVKSKTLEEEWEKGTVAFKTLLTGVTLSGKSCEEVKKEGASLQPVLEARSTPSGTTAGFKRYLSMVGPEKNEFKALTETAEKSLGIEWPKTLPTGYPTETLNGEDNSLVQNVIHTPGSIGYAGLADAMAAGLSTKPGELTPQVLGYQSFYVQVQDNTKEAKEAEYASPESGGASNCSGAEYKGAPAQVEPNADWSQAIDKAIEAGKKTAYSICTLTFDLAWQWADMPEIEGKRVYTEENDAAVYSYLRYIVATEAEAGGQNKALEEKHYAKLPSEIQKAAAIGLDVRSEEPGEGAVKWPEETTEAGDGPGVGPYRVVSVGNSYISGEAGRWAGNSNRSEGIIDALGRTAYFDNPAHNAELIPLCHRSASADIYINMNAATNQPIPGEPQGVNLACSGAKTVSFKEGDIMKPGLDNGIVGVVGQAKLLEEYAKTHNVKMVVISIGGNNLHFADIVEQCVQDFNLSSVFHNFICSTEPKALAYVNAANVAMVTAEITTAVENVMNAMTAAGYENNVAAKKYTIVMQNYESTVPEGPGFRYGEVLGGRQTIGGCGFWNVDANWANTAAIAAVNNAMHNGAAAANPANKPKVRFLDLKTAFNGRRLCENGVGLLEEGGLNRWNVAGAVDATEWVNMIRVLKSIPYLRAAYFRNMLAQEDLHPNYWGQLALRNCLRRAYNRGNPIGGVCTRGVNGLANGEPQMLLGRQRKVNAAAAGSAKGKGHTFSLGKATVKCEEAALTWKLVGQSSSLELIPSYEKCKAVGPESEAAAKVAVKGCTYTLSEFAGSIGVRSWMALSAGCVIEMAATFGTECKIKIEGPQEVETMKISNLNAGTGAFESEIDPEATVLGFTSTGTGCASAGVPEEGLGSYEGKTIAKGLIAEESGTALWHVRQVGESDNGVEAAEGSPEKLQGKGGESKLASKVSGEAATITCAESSSEGNLYNSELAGQAKLLLSLAKCTTTLKHCLVAEPIAIQANAHLTWKWDGLKSSLTQGKQQIFGQKPTIVLSHNEIQTAAPKAEEELTSIKMKKDGVGTCGIEGKPLALKGYESADIEPSGIEQFSKEPKLKFAPGKHLQHYWNGSEETGLETTLTLGGEPAELTGGQALGGITTEGEEQEAAIFEG